MKLSLSLVLVLLGLLAAAGIDDAQATLTVSGCEAIPAQAPDQVCLPIDLVTAGESVAAVAFTLDYDVTEVRLPGGGRDVKKGSGLSASHFFQTVLDESGSVGTIRVVITPPIIIPVPTIPDGQLAEICLTVQPTATGCAALRFVPGTVEIGDDTGQAASFTVPRNGGVCVSPDVDGDGEPDDADGDGIGDTCECGDFNSDGLVNTLDANLIQRCSVGEIPCGGLCDATGDGVCMTTDARMIQRLVVGDFGKDALSCDERP
jgi:hypothetical protein